jgi:processive 1,2-diacylglycerol beta-glucosyltransferase
MTAQHTILVLYLSVGSGHQIAAEAVAEALAEHAPQVTVKVVDPFTDMFNSLPSILDRLQAASIMLTPGLYDTAWRNGIGSQLYEQISELDILQTTLKKHIPESGDCSVLCTHVFPMVVARELKRQGMIAHLFGVVTDYGLHSYWPHTDVDGYFVGHEELCHVFMYRGLDLARVQATGIPIRPAFEKVGSLHLEEGYKLRLLAVIGGTQSGPYIRAQQDIYELLDKLAQLKSAALEVSVVTGRDEHLQRELEAYAGESSLNLQILGYVKMFELMSCHDLLVGKPGGLLISEAMACGLGMIVLRPGPGQERANTDFLARHGAAVNGESPALVARAVEAFLGDRGHLWRVKPAARRLGKPGSARTVAEQVMSLVNSVAA